MSIARIRERGVCGAAAVFLLLTAPALAGESPAELISDVRLMHGEATVVRDETLDRIALEQARAMAAKNEHSHETLGPFGRRIAPARVGRAAENVAYGHDGFKQMLNQWIGSSGHRKNLLLHNAFRVGIASAKGASGKRTYWAMVIAGDFETGQPGKKRKEHPVAQQLNLRAERSGEGLCLTVVTLPAFHASCSHSFSFDERRRPDELRTAMATAFF